MHPDEIARCVLDTFDALPAKRKPLQRSDSTKEWVPLSGIVLERDGSPLRCVALGTGMKCLPRSKIADARGSILHDCHAEIVALRAFNRYLIDECAIFTHEPPAISDVVERRDVDQVTERYPQPFAIRRDVSIHMYCSEAPCGDASMELIMQAQDDATPWEVPQTTTSDDDESIGEVPVDLKGRGYFSELGIVRKKPARADAPLSLSKSCADKLTLRQCTSVLNAAVCVLIHPGRAYISTLVIPKSQHVTNAIFRAFDPSGRISALRAEDMGQWPQAYHFQPFQVVTTELEFSFSRRSSSSGQRMVPSNVTAVYTPRFQETLIGGILSGRKQGDPRATSTIARRPMWRAAAHVVEEIGSPILLEAVRYVTYAEFKSGKLFEDRSKVGHDVKETALKGWIPNSGDDTFGIDER